MLLLTLNDINSVSVEVDVAISARLPSRDFVLVLNHGNYSGTTARHWGHDDALLPTQGYEQILHGRSFGFAALACVLAVLFSFWCCSVLLDRERLRKARAECAAPSVV